MKKSIIITLLIALCCRCCHTKQQIIEDTFIVEDSIVADNFQTLTHNYRTDVIIALYMLGCNDRLEMNLPDDFKENAWSFYSSIDSLANAPDYFEKIETNLAEGNFRQSLQDSINHWLLLSYMLHFPINCNLASPENDIIDQMSQTHHLLDKYIDRNIQCIESLSILQWDYYYYDVVNYLFSLPADKQMDFIIDYYTLIRGHPIDIEFDSFNTNPFKSSIQKP